MATQVEVLQLLKRLTDAFGEIKVHPSIYCVALRDSDASTFDAVYTDMITNYKYGWPRPPDLVTAAEQARVRKDIGLEYCPHCQCKQYQLIYGLERYCMACHTEWEVKP